MASTAIVAATLVIALECVVIVALVRAARRRREEDRLLDSDQLKGAILDSLPAHVAVIDRNGRIIAVNQAWTDFARDNGVAADALVGPGASYLQACVDRAHSGLPEAAEARALIEAACRGERTWWQIEYPRVTPNGDRWFLMTAEPLRHAAGGAVVTHVDITTRKLNEIALRESEGRFRRMADAVPFSVWMSEPDASCSYVNQQWLQMTGRTVDQEMGTGWLEGVHPDDRDRCITAYLRAFQARDTFRVEYRIRRYDGEYRWLMDSGMPRYGSDGEFHGYIGGCIDITDRKEAEELLHHLNRRLLIAQEDERRRIARELHDHLSQQLALLAVDLQQICMKPPKTRDALGDALQAQWRRTTEIASDVHAISHRLHPSKLEALGLVSTVRAHCREMSRQACAVQFVEQNVPAQIPPDVALCLFRVAEQALSNVARHSGASKADVSLFTVGDGDLVLRIIDDGQGLPASNGTGSGLGLISMRERLQLVDGTLTVASQPNHGTTIEARVPHRRIAVPALEEPVDHLSYETQPDFRGAPQPGGPFYAA